MLYLYDMYDVYLYLFMYDCMCMNMDICDEMIYYVHILFDRHYIYDIK